MPFDPSLQVFTLQNSLPQDRPLKGFLHKILRSWVPLRTQYLILYFVIAERFCSSILSRLHSESPFAPLVNGTNKIDFIFRGCVADLAKWGFLLVLKETFLFLFLYPLNQLSRPNIFRDILDDNDVAALLWMPWPDSVANLTFPTRGALFTSDSNIPSFTWASFRSYRPNWALLSCSPWFPHWTW